MQAVPPAAVVLSAVRAGGPGLWLAGCGGRVSAGGALKERAECGDGGRTAGRARLSGASL